MDPSRRPAGCPPAQVARGDDGSVVLNFPAPISGRYVILAAAEPGREGAGVIDTRVQPKPVAAKVIRHPNTPPIDYGVPVSGSASDDLPPR